MPRITMITRRMTRLLYCFLFSLLLPLAFIRLWCLGRRTPAYRQHWKERLGKMPFSVQGAIWIHAVSLGESIAATPLIKKLLAQHPDKPFVVTHMTPTGREYIEKNFGQQVRYGYLPYDIPCLIRRFLKHTQAAQLILIETELWPNLIHEVSKQRIPIVLANARLSERSFLRYQRVKSLITPMLEQLTQVAAQHELDAGRFLKLGLPANHLTITGSIKFDLELPPQILEKGNELKALFIQKPTWIAASLHAGEESKILEAHQALLREIPSALLVIVPRHPEQFIKMRQTVEALCEVVTRSSHLSCTPSTKVFLGDSMGELLTYYAASDIAFVGGSFVPQGGHNLLEPAALSLPVLTGPHYFNFTAITQKLVVEQGALVVETPADLAQTLITLFKNKEARTAMGAKAAKVVASNRGALAKLLGICESSFIDEINFN